MIIHRAHATLYVTNFLTHWDEYSGLLTAGCEGSGEKMDAPTCGEAAVIPLGSYCCGVVVLSHGGVQTMLPWQKYILLRLRILYIDGST